MNEFGGRSRVRQLLLFLPVALLYFRLKARLRVVVIKIGRMASEMQSLVDNIAEARADVIGSAGLPV